MNNDDHSLMLSRICGHVEQFAKTENDSTLLCVLRLLVAYHELKQAELYGAIEREEGKNK